MMHGSSRNSQPLRYIRLVAAQDDMTDFFLFMITQVHRNGHYTCTKSNVLLWGLF
jgi:hypothetical protein